jgi:hypothetical protein
MKIDPDKEDDLIFIECMLSPDQLPSSRFDFLSTSGCEFVRHKNWLTRIDDSLLRCFFCTRNRTSDTLIRQLPQYLPDLDLRRISETRENAPQIPSSASIGFVQNDRCLLCLPTTE